MSDVLAMLRARDGRPALVHRRRGPSDEECDHLLDLDEAIANSIADRGVAVWSTASMHSGGRPGVVIHDAGDGTAVLELRADVADPTTIVSSATMDVDAAVACVLPPGPATLGWTP